MNHRAMTVRKIAITVIANESPQPSRLTGEIPHGTGHPESRGPEPPWKVRPSTGPTNGWPRGLLLSAAALFGCFLCAWKSALEEFDLAIVVGFVFSDVKPFGIVVR